MELRAVTLHSRTVPGVLDAFNAPASPRGIARTAAHPGHTRVVAKFDIPVLHPGNGDESHTESSLESPERFTSGRAGRREQSR